MSDRPDRVTARGPFTADHIRPGDPYELSRGHAVVCLPTGGQGSRAGLVGASVLGTDPDVEEAGVDTGFTPESGTLRAPDVAIGNVPNRPGWVQGTPLLALEYADTGQEESSLQEKIRDLLAGGTRQVWVVRLTGPRRVEVYEREHEMRVVSGGGTLVAEGILRNPLPVEALYDPAVGREAMLRNLLQRHGYASLEAVQHEGRQEGRLEGRLEGQAAAVLDLLTGRGLGVPDDVRQRVRACRDAERLRHWLLRASTATSAAEAID